MSPSDRSTRPLRQSGPTEYALDDILARQHIAPRDHRQQIELRHLRYFVAVAEERNISRAALRLRVSQPPLSHQIKQLETWLQAVLFRRTARGVDLTPAGEEFLEHARILLARLDQAIDAARYVERGTGGKLQLGCVYSVYRLFGSNIEATAEQAFPSLRLNFHVMSVPEQGEALFGESIDVGIVSGEITGDHIQSRILFETPYIAALPANHPLAALPSLRLEDLGDDVARQPDGDPVLSFRQQATNIFKRRGLVAGGLRAVADIALLMELVEAGMGVAIVPGCIAQRNYAKAAFRPIAGLKRPFVVRIVWRAEGLTPLRAAFIEHLARLRWASVASDAPSAAYRDAIPVVRRIDSA